MTLSAEIYVRLRANAVDLDGEALRPLEEAAARHGVTLVLGCHEFDSRYGGTTLYNTLVVIGPDGACLNRHREKGILYGEVTPELARRTRRSLDACDHNWRMATGRRDFVSN